MPTTNNPAEQLQNYMSELYNWCIANNISYLDLCLFPKKADTLKGLASYSVNDASKITHIDFKTKEEE